MLTNRLPAPTWSPIHLSIPPPRASSPRQRRRRRRRVCRRLIPVTIRAVLEPRDRLRRFQPLGVLRRWKEGEHPSRDSDQLLAPKNGLRRLNFRAPLIGIRCGQVLGIVVAHVDMLVSAIHDKCILVLLWLLVAIPLLLNTLHPRKSVLVTHGQNRRPFAQPANTNTSRRSLHIHRRPPGSSVRR